MDVAAGAESLQPHSGSPVSVSAGEVDREARNLNEKHPLLL